MSDKTAAKTPLAKGKNSQKWHEFWVSDLARVLLLVVLILVELAVFSKNPRFFTVNNLLDALRTYTEIGIVAIGMTFVILTGGIDLSVGSLLALVSVTVGFSYQAGCPFGLSLLLGIVVGCIGGLFNGLMIVYGKMHAFVVTLGTYSLYRGLAYGLTNAEAVSVFPDFFSVFGNSYLGGVVPVQLLIYLGIAAVMWIIFKLMPYGTNVSAIGYNENAARFSGIRVRRDKVMVYVISGLMVAFAAIIYTSRMSTARGNAGENMELYAITAVILGGTDINGGRGTLEGTLLGTVVLALMKNGLAMLDIRNDWALFVTGFIVLASMLLNQVMQRQSD